MGWHLPLIACISWNLQKLRREGEEKKYSERDRNKSRSRNRNSDGCARNDGSLSRQGKQVCDVGCKQRVTILLLSSSFVWESLISISSARTQRKDSCQPCKKMQGQDSLGPESHRRYKPRDAITPPPPPDRTPQTPSTPHPRSS